MLPAAESCGWYSVLDMNVVASGLLWEGGPPARLIDAARAGEIEIFSSKPLLAELARVVARTKSYRAIGTCSTLGVSATCQSFDPRRQ